MKNLKQQISLLNELIEINNDRITVYKKATQIIKEEKYLSLFYKHIFESLKFVDELNDFIETLQENSRKEPIAEKIQSYWINVKLKTINPSKKQILEYCERTEKRAIEGYNIFLVGPNIHLINMECVAIMHEQCDILTNAYNEIRNFKEYDAIN